MPTFVTNPHSLTMLNPYHPSKTMNKNCASLKTRALRLSESLSITLACFCKPRLGESISLGREQQISPLFSLQQPHFHTQTTIQALRMFIVTYSPYNTKQNQE